jgi:hypothetical protein
MLEAIPDRIPMGFNLRVKCSSLHENSRKKMARCRFGSDPMFFGMPEDATIERLKELVADWMRQRGQGEDWTINGSDRKQIDFDIEYQVDAIERIIPFTIFLKEKPNEVGPSESWINVSDRLVRAWNLPLGTILRIFQVIGSVDNQNSEDYSYTVTWEDGKQYWYDIAYDDARDRNSHAKLIRMIDGYGRVDKMVIRKNASDLQILNQWKALLEIPDAIRLGIRTRNNTDYFWTYRSVPDPIPCVFRTRATQGNANICDGPQQFKAEQIGRILDIKMPPISQCHVSRENGGPVIIQFDGEVVRLGLKILNEHLLSWNLEGQILADPNLSTWWYQYDLGKIMRHGHRINTEIPEDPDQAIFPNLPWPERVVIRIKSQAPPQIPAAPLPAGGNPLPLVSGSPSGWQGVALGQAQPISADASGLVGYNSPNQGQDGSKMGDLPPDPELLRFRGEDKKDEEVHSIISWTTRKSYPLWAGISLPARYKVGDEFHEMQLWEETPDDKSLKKDTQRLSTTGLWRE